MALARTSPLIAALSGNLEGVNFANTRFGQVVRSRKPPPPAPSESQLLHRRAMQQCRSAWHDITDVQRTAWRAMATTTPFANRLGVQRNLTGHQFFIRLNFENALLGFPLLSEPPAVIPFTWPTSLDVHAVAGDFILVSPHPYIPPGGQLLTVSGARPVTSSPINHFSRWASLGVFIVQPAGWFYCLDEFQARFGAIQPGERIGIRVRALIPLFPRLNYLEQATTVSPV